MRLILALLLSASACWADGYYTEFPWSAAYVVELATGVANLSVPPDTNASFTGGRYAPPGYLDGTINVFLLTVSSNYVGTTTCYNWGAKVTSDYTNFSAYALNTDKNNSQFYNWDQAWKLSWPSATGQLYWVGFLYPTGYSDTTSYSNLIVQATNGYPQIYIPNTGPSPSYYVYLTNSPFDSGRFRWVTNGIVNLSVNPTAVAAYTNGDIVTVGNFQGNLNFGTGNLSTFGNQDVFVAKHNSSGSLLWSKSFGETWEDAVAGVCIDRSGNIIIAGSYNGTLDFTGNGTGISNTTLFSSAGQTDFYVVKYSPAGVISWVRSFGGTGSETAWNVAIDKNDDVIASLKYVSSSVVFDAFTVYSSNKTGAAVVKLSGTNGVALWAKYYVASPISAYGLTVDRSNNVVVCGGFFGSTDLGFGTVTNAGGSDIFLVKHAGSNGVPIWSKTAGGVDSDAAKSVTSDPVTGDIITTGSYLTNCNFGGPITNAFGVTNTKGGIFLWDIDSGGTNRWAFSPNVPELAIGGIGNWVTCDSDGNIYYTGSATATLYFCTTFPGSGSGSDVFTASVTRNGVYRWAHRSGGSTGNSGSGLALDTSGHLIVVGAYAGTTIYFDNQLGSAGGSATTSGTRAPFIVQYAK